MPYSPSVERALKKAEVTPGSQVELSLVNGSKIQGLLLPRMRLGEPDVLAIKLPNGYNIGISHKKVKELNKGHATGEHSGLDKHGRSVYKHFEGLPDISMVATGGTISARVDYKLGGVKTILDPHEIFSVVPELEGVVNFKSILSPFTIWSENMCPKDWCEIATHVADEINKGSKGVVVTHGTDTLSYTAAALSFMLPNLSRPVALVGAQRSPDRGSFDGAMNLVAASRYAGYSDIAEVSIVMHGSASDDFCNAIRGTKVRKMHTSRRDAFRPVNDSPIARIWPDGKIEKLQGYRHATDDKVKADTKFEDKVALIKAYPGSTPDILDFLVEKKMKGVVVEATAMGHVALEPRDKRYSWTNSVKNAIDNGVVVAFATQCLYGSANPYVYEAGRMLFELGVVACKDMLPEVAYIKLGFLLGHKLPAQMVREKLLENLAGELNPRQTHNQFLN